MDTVHAVGTFGAEPFLVKDDRVYVPGVYDMKGGNVIALFALRALNVFKFIAVHNPCLEWKTPIYQKSHVNYSELLPLAKGWSNLVSNRIIIWRLQCRRWRYGQKALWNAEDNG